MNIVHAALLGLIEGATEFLPVSSTAHLLLAERVFALPSTEFLKSFTIAIQLGSIMAIALIEKDTLLFWKYWNTWKKILAAFVPTAIIGVLAYPIIKKFLMESPTIIGLVLIFGGLVILGVERKMKHTPPQETEISLHKASAIGFAQALAMIPGISRSGATIISGLLLGIKRETIVQFSFLLSIPTIAAATLLDLFKTGLSFSPYEYGLLSCGFVAAMISGYMAARFLLQYVATHNFSRFGWYRIALGIIVLASTFLTPSH